jgi:hypothetical protein
MTVARTWTGEHITGYCAVAARGPVPRLRTRLRLELGSLRRLPDRLHRLPHHLVSADGLTLYTVRREGGRWTVRPTLGRRSYRVLARPLAVAPAGVGGQLAAEAWAAELLGVEVP